MAAIAFYQEFCDQDKTEPTGNVVVVYPKTRHSVAGQLVYEGLGRCYPSILQHAQTPIESNQPVTNWKVDALWLRQYCKPLSEKQARQVHPYLFESHLDAALQEQRMQERQRRLHLFCTLAAGLAFVSCFIQKIQVSQRRSHGDLQSAFRHWRCPLP